MAELFFDMGQCDESLNFAASVLEKFVKTHETQKKLTGFVGCRQPPKLTA
jgi:hypothetical protein